MNKIIIIILASFLSVTANSAVCQQIRAIEGFAAAPLFSNAIINGKPLDYYTFASDCGTGCLMKALKKKGIAYSLTGSNLSIFDKSSVATVTIDSTYKQSIAGYMTCSSTAKRSYVPNPVSINNNKVSLDLQTEDYKNVTRTINMQGYSKSEYARLLTQLNKLSHNVESSIGFTNYILKSSRSQKVIKISKLSPRGDFIFIIEVSK
ncbi:hypothetical protein FOR85_12125 [Psychrobacter sp. YGAH215]|uniref:hypothetical protein n=1 Tax=Psychrobacter sp. YGAH215 TaxID=2596826 RepID=UPI001186851C|nr:hypothetical protein [Psychrobacter sp. YGAH215]TSB21775.1 hypothetical protein FOR85_12125 [Psychrobacter sp. YGAH215]